MSCANAEKFCKACSVYYRTRSEQDYDSGVQKLLKDSAKAAVWISIPGPTFDQGNKPLEFYEKCEPFVRACNGCNYEGALMAQRIDDYFGGK
ncbi:MAG: hypothetical protein ABIF40_03545 [archaeon]